MSKFVLMCLYSLSSVVTMFQITRGDYPRITTRSRRDDIIALIIMLWCASVLATM